MWGRQTAEFKRRQHTNHQNITSPHGVCPSLVDCSRKVSMEGGSPDELPRGVGVTWQWEKKRKVKDLACSLHVPGLQGRRGAVPDLFWCNWRVVLACRGPEGKRWLGLSFSVHGFSPVLKEREMYLFRWHLISIYKHLGVHRAGRREMLRKRMLDKVTSVRKDLQGKAL